MLACRSLADSALILRMTTASHSGHISGAIPRTATVLRLGLTILLLAVAGCQDQTALNPPSSAAPTINPEPAANRTIRPELGSFNLNKRHGLGDWDKRPQTTEADLLHRLSTETP